MSATLDITAFESSFRKYAARHHAACRRGVVAFVKHVLSEAQALCPVNVDPGAGGAGGERGGRPGTLRDSAAMGELLERGSEISQEFGFTADYAAIVHEALDVHHAHGQAKFLEQAMRDNLPNLRKFIEAELRAEFGN